MTMIILSWMNNYFKDPLGKMLWYNALGADNLRWRIWSENKFQYDYVLKMRFGLFFFLRTWDLNDINSESN